MDRVIFCSDMNNCYARIEKYKWFVESKYPR